MARLRRDRPAQIAMQWVNLLLALIVLSIGLVLVVAAPAEAEQFATLHPLESTVEVSDDGEPFRGGREGQVLSAGDTVRTGADGRAEIEYFDDSITRLENDTTFSLEELTTNRDVPNSKTIVAEQEEGRTFERVVAITDSESRFDVETPTATASVRGTTYVLNHLPDGTVIIWVLPDDDPEIGEVVFILDDGTEIVVREGEGVTAFPDGAAGVPFMLTEEQLADAWVLYNLCELDALPIDTCETDDLFPPIDPLDPAEEEPEVLGEDTRPPQEEPGPSPPAPASFSSGDGTTTTTTSTGGDGDGSGPKDNTPPRTTITSAPSEFTQSRSAAFRFRANEPVRFFECSLNGGSFSRCNSGRTYTGLSDGTHLFQVRATDRAGNRENTASHRWTVDNDPPLTEITEAPEDNFGPVPTSGSRTSSGESDTYRFEFQADEPSTFECSFDGSPFSACTSPHTEPRSFGDHTFEVRATDRAGNVESPPADHGWFDCYDQCVGEGSAARGGTDASLQEAAEAVAAGAQLDVVTTVQGVVHEVTGAVTGAVDDATGTVEGTKDGLLERVTLPDAPALPR